MKAMILKKKYNLKKNKEPLEYVEKEIRNIKQDEILLKVKTCGVCHTELDEIEGRTLPPNFPIIPGHEVVGEVINRGKNITSVQKNDRVGVAWIYSACGKCEFCKNGQENLCKQFLATGRDADGGYAEYMIAKKGFFYKIPQYLNNSEAAPLLCAGAVGYRSLRLTNLHNGQLLGLTGFGASGHLVLKMVKEKYPDSKIYVFARNKNERKFAIELGASWSGKTEAYAPEKLDAIIDTTPVWKPDVEALKNLKPGGRLVINAIRKENVDKKYLLNLNYKEHLWMEKEIKSVANVTPKDVKDFLKLAAEIKIKPEYRDYKLKEANKALLELKTGNIKGAKVLVMDT